MTTTAPQPGDALPTWEQVTYHLRGPHVVRGAAEPLLTDGELVVGYTRVSTDDARRWTIRFAVDRLHLLPLSNAGRIALRPQEILQLNIIDPVTLVFEPDRALAAELDRLEGAGRLTSRAGDLDPPVARRVLDLRRLTYIEAVQ